MAMRGHLIIRKQLALRGEKTMTTSFRHGKLPAESILNIISITFWMADAPCGFFRMPMEHWANLAPRHAPTNGAAT